VMKRILSGSSLPSAGETRSKKKVLDCAARDVCDTDVIGLLEGEATVFDAVFMRNNKVRDIGAVSLALSSVRHLHLGVNYVGSDGGDALASSSCKKGSRLHTLLLDSNFVEADAFAQALAYRDCSLEHLDLAGNNYDNEGMVALGTALIGNRKLRSLDLGNNNVCISSVHVLPEALRRNKTLLGLTLNENEQIGDEGAKELAAALRENKCLATINLSESGVTSDGIGHLARNRTVSTLHLTNGGRDVMSEHHLRCV
jgi:hypothetical protein